MTEAELSKKIREYALSKGCIAVKLDTSEIGWPDRILLYKDNTLFIEVKSPKLAKAEDGLRPIQKYRLDYIGAHCENVYVVNNFAEAKYIIDFFVDSGNKQNQLGDFGKCVADFNDKILMKRIDFRTCDIFNDVEARRILTKRMAFMLEEFSELQCAIANEDLVGMCDALVDLLYFLLGTFDAFNLPLRELFNEVHRSNLSKMAGKTKRGFEGDAAKGETFSPPDLVSIIEKQYKEM